jgi:hypothetical protein
MARGLIRLKLIKSKRLKECETVDWQQVAYSFANINLSWAVIRQHSLLGDVRSKDLNVDYADLIISLKLNNFLAQDDYFRGVTFV